VDKSRSVAALEMLTALSKREYFERYLQKVS